MLNIMNEPNNKNNDENDILYNLKKQLVILTKEKFSAVIYDDNKIATLLSPNFKKFKFVNEKIRNEEINTIKKLISNKIYCHQKLFNININVAPKKRKSYTLEDYEIDTESDEENKDELEIYLKEKVNEIFENPLEYWENSKFKILKEISKEVFSRPASSSSSERVFSYSKKILKKDRYRLNSETLSKLTVFSNNILNKSI